jgi:hypothetical protein
MECSEPGAIRDEDLIAYLSGDQVHPAIAQHIASCQSCSSRLASYQQVDQALSGKLFRYDCPPSHMLGEYHLGMLAKPQMSLVANHLRVCAFCTAEVAQLKGFLAGDPFLVERTPAARNSHARIQDIKQATRRVREQTQAGVRRIAAILVPQQPGLAFQRNASQLAPVWPRRYNAEDVSIAVQVERISGNNNALQVLGIVTRKDTSLEALEGTPVQLISGTTTAYTQSIDDLGNFLFPVVTPATYTLELHFPSGIVVIDQLPAYPSE